MSFDATVIDAVTRHMNGDHADDNLLIARAFGAPEASASQMIGLDERAGVWRVTDPAGERELRVEWPGGAIAERPEIRREVVVLYQAACERLGIAPREEHGAGSEARHRSEAETETAAEAPQPFSQQLREATWSDHSDSEGAGFMESIMRGTASLDDYVALAAQHYFMYDALESVAEGLAEDPAFAPFHPAGLARMASIEADLAHLLGDEWSERISPTPATERYAARIRQVGDEGWLAGLVAHHYTRYLGDLSGGQMIARRVSKQHGLDSAGVEFYAFPELGDLAEFKNAYRAELDRLGEALSAEERARVVEEVRLAYRFNTETFVDLARARAVVG